MSRLVEVAFALPLDSTFTYNLPSDMADVSLGHRVLVPFQRRSLTGYVVDLPAEAGAIETKSIHAVLDESPLLTEELIELVRFMAKMYGASFGECLQTVLPAGLIRQSRRRLIRTDQEGEPKNEEERRWVERIGKSRTGLSWVTVIKREPKALKLLRSLEREGWIRVETVLETERARTPKKLKARTAIDPEKMFAARSITELSTDQTHAVAMISDALSKREPHSFLLHGITGSGKTEIYLQMTSRALEQGRNVMALVPEIALTPQFVGRFQSRFGDSIALLHSARSETERLAEWKRIRTGEVRVVIGARSAVFAPITNLGLIVLDEEHDHSYKQEDGLPYNARDLARFRSKRDGAVLLVGSATPALETYHSALSGEIDLLQLPKRVTEHNLPEVEVVDLRKEAETSGEKRLISARLREAIEDVLGRDEQAVLFLNRRGFAPFVLCPTCGEGLSCTSCSVSLAYHKSEDAYLCHYCGHSEAAGSACQSCGQAKLIPIGIGTERIEQELRYLFPDARIERMDRDAVRGKGKHEAILTRMAKRQIDILLGTQMVAKGMDFPHVSLSAVLLADQSLHLPDFRAAERTFQLLTQVVGRSGRGDRPGKAMIQAFQTEHYAIAAAAEQDYLRFFDQEIEFRKRLKYPPYGALALLELHGREEEAVRGAAIWLGREVQKILVKSKNGIEVLGPAPAPLRMIQGRTRYHLLVRSEPGGKAHAFCRWLAEEARKTVFPRGVSVRADLDPYRFL